MKATSGYLNLPVRTIVRARADVAATAAKRSAIEATAVLRGLRRIEKFSYLEEVRHKEEARHGSGTH